MKIVVTGGAGFIGSNLVRRLLEEGHEVRVIDNLITGDINNLYDVFKDIEFLGGDILNLGFLKEAFEGADAVFHEAALTSVPRSIATPASTHEINVDGTFNVFLAAKEKGVGKVIFASSSSVYGNRDSGNKGKSEILRAQPLSPYAVTKIIGEGYAKVFSHIYGLPTVCLRYFNVFGPRQNPNSQYSAVIPKFITNIMKEEEITVFGDGEQMRDFTFVDNVVEANLLALKAKKLVMGETINIACGDSISVNQLIDNISEITRKKAKVKFEEARPGEVRNSRADISKAEKLLGYKPKTGFKEGLSKTVEWYQKR